MREAQKSPPPLEAPRGGGELQNLNCKFKTLASWILQTKLYSRKKQQTKFFMHFTLRFRFEKCCSEFSQIISYEQNPHSTCYNWTNYIFFSSIFIFLQFITNILYSCNWSLCYFMAFEHDLNWTFFIFF